MPADLQRAGGTDAEPTVILLNAARCGKKAPGRTRGSKGRLRWRPQASYHD